MADGHPNAMYYSVRQIEALIWFYDRRKNREAARNLQISHMAHHSSPKEVNKKVKEWTK